MSAGGKRSVGALLVLAIVAALVIALLVLPGGIGRLLGQLWVTVMGAVIGLLGGMVGH